MSVSSGTGKMFTFPRIPCKGTSGEHKDAQKLVAYLIAQGLGTDDSNDEVASKVFRLSHGMPDTGRFHRARNHIRDRVEEADASKPCTGYTLHYRGINNSRLELIDPNASLANRGRAALHHLLGVVTRERQHQTEMARNAASFMAMGNECSMAGDTYGASLNYRCATEIDTVGTITPRSLGEYHAWVDSLPI
jgi:hypothetical protein